ncbi:MAG: Fe-S cluster assembly protein SufB [Candidatus Magasanikbacteria bacterium]|nr:Fe-S cluster assembly protein SufB [Candidatus Magasanikbacteria bacterium]
MDQDLARKRMDLDKADDVTAAIIVKPGIREDVVDLISDTKGEPDWMRARRKKALFALQETSVPNWGPVLSDLDLETIVYYMPPGTGEQHAWEDVPEEIRSTFERLGIPEAERAALAGVGAQYDSDVVYHSIQEDLAKQGVIFMNMDAALLEHEELIKKYFMTQCVPMTDHYFAMIHAAVWSGGTFIYVPKGVQVDLPLQAYFRMNTQNGGQFEHTLIIADEGSSVSYIEGCSAPRYTTNSLHAGCVEIFVHKNASVKYYSIENWSKNTFNLNTKRALVDAHGSIEWINGNMGSGVTMLYPSSVLRGEGAKSDSLGIAFAGPGQYQDTGAKAIHAAPNTYSTIRAKSISKGDGVASYRGYVNVLPNATGVKTTVECDALLMNELSRSITIPVMSVKNDSATIAHEATVGRIGDDELFYLQSRGLTADEAQRAVVAGFVEPVVKALPLEYAVELNRLIQLEMEGSVG